MKQKTTIVKKLIIYFLLLNIFTLVVVGSYSYYRAKDALVERTFDQLTSLRIEKKYRIERFFEDRILDLNLISKSEDVANIIQLLNSSLKENNSSFLIEQEYNNYLNKHLTSTNYYKQFYIINKKGQVVYFNAKNDTILPNYTLVEYLPINNLHKVIQNNSGIAIEDYKLDSSLKEPTIFMGTQVMDNSGYEIGSAIIEIDIDAINSIMYENNPHNGLGESGESYLVGNDFLMRSTSRFQDQSIFKTVVNTIGLKKALEGKTGAEIIKDYRNISVLSSYSKVDIPVLDWAILAEIDEKEAMIPIDSIRNNILYLSILMSLLLFAFVYIIARRISLPIIQLKHAAQKIAEGNYNVFVEDIVSNDEIGSLVVAFNEMSAKIKEQTEKINLERSMRLSSMIDGQELERQRLSRELHDGLGQSILAIKMRLERVNKVSPEKAKIIMSEVQDLFTNTINEVRSISNDLMPAVLNEFGLVDALSNLCREISENSGVKVNFHHKEFPGEIPAKTSTYLYRISQEALSNIIKHANAKTAEIELASDAENIYLSISDSGIGFCYKEDRKLCGNGISNMKERVFLLKGEIEISSNKKNGTKIRIKAPLSI